MYINVPIIMGHTEMWRTLFKLEKESNYIASSVNKMAKFQSYNIQFVTYFNSEGDFIPIFQTKSTVICQTI